MGRRAAAMIRDEAAAIRTDAARVRDEGARTRDDAARVRDQAALVRDQASRARDDAARVREEATRVRIAQAAPVMSREAWTALLELDREATDHSQRATTRDREAAVLDRRAAEKDREAAERDRTAANSDRLAADRDRDAADQDRAAAEADRSAADADLDSSDHDLLMAEKRLSRTERLSALGRISAGIAHELNTPLATLLSNLDVLEDERASLSQGDEARLLADLRLSAERIAGVVKDMRTWVRGDDAQAARAPVDLAKLLGAVLERARPDLEGRGRVNVSLAPLPELWGVASRLERALMSLLVSVAHAMPEGRPENELRVSAIAKGSLVHVELSDNGPGLAPDVLPHLFDPFYVTREGEGGTGLGLAMCEQIFSDHGGSISVESTLGQGTLFRITLPVEAPAQPVAEVTRSGGRPTPQVLIIDDDAALVRSIERQLGGRCEVIIARNGQEGLAQLSGPAQPWALILCDLSMPVMSGVQFYRRLGTQAPELAARVVFMTGGALDEDTEAFLAAIPNFKLQKPFPPRALVQLLESAAP